MHSETARPTMSLLGVKLFFLLSIISFFSLHASAQEEAPITDAHLYRLAVEDLPAFAHQLTAEESTDLGRAQRVVQWLANYFNWTYTDYQKRNVQEILERKGGNCNELAMVAQACLEALEIPIRRVREINLHIPTPRRQTSAEQKVKELGNRASVFGHRHNDHVWLEIYDDQQKRWIPADPSLGVVGDRQWLAARYAFGKRYSLDPSSADMIAPFAGFTVEDGKWESRTVRYAVDGFNDLYYGQLAGLPSWENWVRQIKAMNDLALDAFRGEINLHEHTGDIKALHDTYTALREEFLQTDLGQIHSGIDAFSAALIAGKYDQVVDAYTEDARIFPNNAPILEGHEAIRAYWTPPADRTSRTVHHRIIPEEIKVLGKEAYDWGYYEGRTRLEDGSEIPWRGKYVIVWKKTTDGRWRMYLDIWNRVAD